MIIKMGLRMFSITEFIYSKILKREYPRLKVCKRNVPAFGGAIPTIFLGLSKTTIDEWRIQGNIEDAVAEILSHEYLHYVLEKNIDYDTSSLLDLVNKWILGKQKMGWKMKRGKEYVWETF